MKKKWLDMTDEEIKNVVKAIFGGLRLRYFKTDDEANSAAEELIKNELGYDATLSIHSISTSCGEMSMRQFQAMMFGPSGNTITVF